MQTRFLHLLSWLSIITVAINPLFGEEYTDSFRLPSQCDQLIVGLAGTWDSSNATLYLLQRHHDSWKLENVGGWPARLGRNGLAWGRGIHPLPQPGKQKTEGDKRSPAGIFKLGHVWGYEKHAKTHPNQTYRQITPLDLWVEDPQSAHYNKHIRLSRSPRTQWEKAQQMHQNDYPHSLKLFIAHNSGQSIKANAGSAIFFHIWRNQGKSATAGCTTLEEKNLRRLAMWLDPNTQPLFILLPREQYAALEEAWSLPRLDLFTAQP